MGRRKKVKSPDSPLNFSLSSPISKDDGTQEVGWCKGEKRSRVEIEVLKPAKLRAGAGIRDGVGAGKDGDGTGKHGMASKDAKRYAGSYLPKFKWSCSDDAYQTEPAYHRQEQPGDESSFDSFGQSSASTCSDSTCTLGENDFELKEMIEKMEKRRRKKDRQKAKKRARRLALERKRSMHNLLVTENSGWSQSVLHLKEKIVGIITKPFSPIPLDGTSLVVHRSPVVTFEYFLREITCLLVDGMRRNPDVPPCLMLYFMICRFFLVESQNYKKEMVWRKGKRHSRDVNRRGQQQKYLCVWRLFLLMLCITIAAGLSYLWISANDPVSEKLKKKVLWLLYWVFLGILSSVGLGTGLHTFVLYLGPFIAHVTMAAKECGSVEFPDPPYPDQITCPPQAEAEQHHYESPSIFTIASKVRWESLSWGVGTALGELPPYFVARAARIAGNTSISSKRDKKGKKDGFQKIKRLMETFILKVGFWGILVCASIPNPLFDLAGISCGHFLVPFSTFFCATLIGKSLIKSQIQVLFVILSFSEASLRRVLKAIETIPYVGPSLQFTVGEFVDDLRASLWNTDDGSSSGGIVKFVFEAFVFTLVLYFICSIVNGMAQNYHKRLSNSEESLKRRQKEKKALAKAKKHVQIFDDDDDLNYSSHF